MRVLHTDNLVTIDPRTGKTVVHGVVHDITDPMDIADRPLAAVGPFPEHCLVVNVEGIVLRSNGIMRESLVHSEPGGSVFRLFAAGECHEALEAAMDEVEAGKGPCRVSLVVEGEDEHVTSWYTVQSWNEGERLNGFIIAPERNDTLAPLPREKDATGLGRATTPISGAWEFEVATAEAIWSGGMYEILDMPPTDPPLSAEAFRSMVHPEDEAYYRSRLESFQANKQPLTLTFRIISAKGVEKRVSAHVEAISRTGPFSHAFGTLMDISTQDALYGAAREQELQVRTLQQSLGQMNLRLLESNLRLSKAQEDERARIAENLHDHAGGLITSLNLIVSQMAEDGVEDHLASARRMLDELGNRIRQTTRQLRPNVLSRFGIEAAIQELSQDMSSLAGLELQLDTRNPGIRMDGRTTTLTFRIAREAMMNVVRHAEATTMWVTFGPLDDQIVLRIEDDGHGFDLERALSDSSIGLESMYDRADSIDGRLIIRPRTGGGTTVELQIPKRG